MRYLRVLWSLLRELAKGPEGLTPEELAHFAARRAALRGIVALALIPVVLLAIFAWPRLKEVRHRYAQPCTELVPAEVVARWAGHSVDAADVDLGFYGCAVTWTGVAGPALEVRVRTPGGLIVDGTSRALDGGSRVPQADRPWVERWDWDREESVQVLHVPGQGDTAVVALSGASLVLASARADAPDLGPLVTAALENAPLAEAYVAWLRR